MWVASGQRQQKTFIESWKMLLQAEKWQFMLVTGNPFVKVLPSVTWKKENESNRFMGLGRMVYRQNAKSVSWLLLTACNRAQWEREGFRNKPISLQSTFRGNVDNFCRKSRSVNKWLQLTRTFSKFPSIRSICKMQ